MARPIGIVAVDAGSNAIRALVGRAHAATEITQLASERWAVRLGHNVFTHGRFTSSNVAHAAEAFRHFRALIQKYDIHLYRAVATAATREAENRELLLNRIFRESGIRLEAIDAAEEARLTRLAVHCTLGEGKPRLIADLGGGSLEISLLRERRVEQSFALPVGTVRLMESMNLGGVVDEDQFARLRHYLTSLLVSAWPRPSSLAGETAVLCGGNAEALARLSPGPKHRGVPTINLRLLRDRVWEILRRDIRARMRVFNLRRDRAEVIGLAAVVFLCLAEHTRMETALVPGVGVREGILFDLAAEHFRSPGADKHRAEGLVERARSFAAKMQCDMKHAEHVRMLAASLFDQLADLHTRPPEDRLPLEMAALMHQIGMNVNPRGHHKHGEYIVQHAELGGISQGLQAIVACLVRYHGKSRPEPHHKLYASLTARQRRLVRELSSILRIANGLDDGELQTVRELRVRMRKKSVRFQFHATPNALVDIAALQRKARPFAEEFGIRANFKRGRSAPQQPRAAHTNDHGSFNSWKAPLTGNVWTLSA